MASLNNMFAYTLQPRDISKFTLFRGVTDYTQLQQFDLFETGYGFLICLDIPKFLDKLTALNASGLGGYKNLMDQYRHIIEWEFLGVQGIEDITADVSPISNGITDINVITKVNEQGGSTFTMNYFERSGSILTKVNELFLRGIKDPKTQVKRYNGLLWNAFQQRNDYTNSAGDGSTDYSNNIMTESGYQYEIFHFLYIVTDNTCLNIEKAYLLACCQPTTANTSIYNVTRGEIQFQQLGLQFNGIPLPGRAVNKKATQFLEYINDHTCFTEMDYGYHALDESDYSITGGTNGSFVRNIEASNSGNYELYSTTVDQIQIGDYKTKDNGFTQKGYVGVNTSGASVAAGSYSDSYYIGSTTNDTTLSGNTTGVSVYGGLEGNDTLYSGGGGN